LNESLRRLRRGIKPRLRSKIMKSITQKIDEKYFNLLWRALSEKESKIVHNLSVLDCESDEAVLEGNELIYLRLCKKGLKEKAEKAGFSQDAFCLEEGIIDLRDLA
jgi:hypothetical protein